MQIKFLFKNCCIDFLCVFPPTGRAEHQTTIFHLPLAHPVVISGVPPARCHPHLGHTFF